MKKTIALFLALCFACMPATTCFAATKVDSDNTMASGWSSWTPGVTKDGSINHDRTTISRIVAVLVAAADHIITGASLIKALGQTMTVEALAELLYDDMLSIDNDFYYTSIIQYRTNASTNQIEERVTTKIYRNSARTDLYTTMVSSHVEDIVNRVGPVEQ